MLRFLTRATSKPALDLTPCFSEEVTSHDQNLREGTDMWQAEAHIYSSGSWHLWGVSLQESLLKKSGSIVICMKADSASMLAPSNGSCLFDGWAGRAVSWQARDSEPAWSARFWQAVCLDLLLWRAIAQKAFVISRAWGCWIMSVSILCRHNSPGSKLCYLYYPNWEEGQVQLMAGQTCPSIACQQVILRWLGILPCTT